MSDYNVQQLSQGGKDGWSLGQSASDKGSFFGGTPAVQPVSADLKAVATAEATNTTPYGFSTKAQADDLVKAVNALTAAFKALNLARSA